MIKSHEQFLEACELMSLSLTEKKEVMTSCEQKIGSEMKENGSVLTVKKQELVKEEELLFSVEDKWIRGQIAKDTDERWYKVIRQVSTT